MSISTSSGGANRKPQSSGEQAADACPLPSIMSSRSPSRFVSASVVDASGGLSEAVAAYPSGEDDAVIAAPAPTRTVHEDDDPPDEIPEVEDDKEASIRNVVSSNKNADDDEEEEDDEESEYEYEDDDDAAFSGFLLASAHATLPSNNNINKARSMERDRDKSPVRIVEEDATTSSVASVQVEEPSDRKYKWREPSRAAVRMSLRAQQETTGTKRRLAQDLYRIMNQETEDAGFSLAPQSEDAMDKWTIKLFHFDQDSNLAKDMQVLGITHIELEMKFPDQYPFEPPFVRVVKPRFKRQTGFVMNGALCMELLTNDGWNPINDIESVIVSIRSLLVVGDGRLQAAMDLPDSKYQSLLQAAVASASSDNKTTDDDTSERKRQRLDEKESSSPSRNNNKKSADQEDKSKDQLVGTYSAAEAQAAYSHLSDYHKKKGWDTSGWWAKKG